MSLQSMVPNPLSGNGSCCVLIASNSSPSSTIPMRQPLCSGFAVDHYLNYFLIPFMIVAHKCYWAQKQGSNTSKKQNHDLFFQCIKQSKLVGHQTWVTVILKGYHVVCTWHNLRTVLHLERFILILLKLERPAIMLSHSMSRSPANTNVFYQ